MTKRLSRSLAGLRASKLLNLLTSERFTLLDPNLLKALSIIDCLE